MMDNDALVEHLRREGLIRTGPVERAFRSVDRSLFVREEYRREAYSDTPLPTRDGQTISAPHMVAIMAEELNALPGMKVLEIGGGSGYHAAIISRLVAPKGRVVSIEKIGALADWGRRNLLKAGIDNVEMVHGDGSLGYEPVAPYDRIYYTAGAPEVPERVKGQLSKDGVILGVVGPAYGTMRLIRMTREGQVWKEEKLTYCVFVPLIGELGYR